MKKIYSALLILSLLACNRNPNVKEALNEQQIVEEVSTSNTNFNAAKQTETAASEVNEQTNNRKIIWKANLEFQVNNVDQATSTIKDIANKYNAFVSNMKLTSGYQKISNRITIRVASSKFDELLEAIKGESIYMKNIEINSQDVTEEFIDITSRLQTKKTVRDRYIKILREKTGDVKDIIEAEEAIRKITEEIEAKEGRLRYLTDKVKFSTITLNVYQEVAYKKEPTVYIKPYSEKIIDGLKNGWSIVTSLFLAIINIWPLLILVSLLIWKRKWIKSKFK